MYNRWKNLDEEWRYLKFFWEKLTALLKHKSLKSRFTFISSPILFHHIDVGIFRDFRRQKFENFFSLVYITRHDEMSDQQASFCQPVLVKDQISDLTMHLLKDKNSNVYLKHTNLKNGKTTWKITFRDLHIHNEYERRSMKKS